MNTDTYIRESCEIQNADAPEDYIGMARAYEYAWFNIYSRPSFLLTMSDLAPLICRVRYEPTWVHFRSQPAIFANGRTALDSLHIQRQLELLMRNQNTLTPAEFYWRFEEIHPWDDGNGRVGSLLYNLLNDTLENPVHPPDHPNWV